MNTCCRYDWNLFFLMNAIYKSDKDKHLQSSGWSALHFYKMG